MEQPDGVCFEGVSRTALRERAEAFSRFDAWCESRHCTLDAAASLACLGFLFDLLPESSRRPPVDPSGVMALRRLLAAGFSPR